MVSAAMAPVNAPPPPASGCGSREGAGLPTPSLPAADAVAANLGIPTTPAPAPGSGPAPILFQPPLPSAMAMRRPVPAHPAESSGSVASPRHAIQTPPPRSIPPPPAPAVESPAPTPATPQSEQWWPSDEVALLNALRLYRRRNGDALPRGVDLVMAVFGRLTQTNYSLADIEALRRRFEENDAKLRAGTGGPAAGHDVQLYTLSLDVWGAAVTTIAAPKPPPPAAEAAVNPPAKKNPGRPCGREPVQAPKRRRYEEMRQRCPMLAGMVEELMKKAMEGVSDVAAWSMEMRMKNQQLAGGVVEAVAQAEDRLKELTGLIMRVV